MNATVTGILMLSLLIAVGGRVDAGDLSQEEIALGEKRKSAEIKSREAEIHELDLARTAAVRRRNPEEAKRLIALIKKKRGELKEIRQRPIEGFAQQAAEETASAEKAAKAAAVLAEQLAARQQAEKKFEAARKASGCPLVVAKIEIDNISEASVRAVLADPRVNPNYHVRFGELRPGQYTSGFSVRITVSNASEQSVASWEIEVEQLDAFGGRLDSVLAQGRSLGVADGVAIAEFAAQQNADTARVTFTRVAFDDGTTWVRKPDSLGTSVRLASGKGATRLILDTEEHAARRPGPRQQEDGVAAGGKLRSGDVLRAGGELVAIQGAYALTLTAAGNLELYRKSDGSRMWESGTQGSNASEMRLQADGNLVLSKADGTAAWGSNTAGNPGAFLWVQDDGNLVLYVGERAIWATSTNE